MEKRGAGLSWEVRTNGPTRSAKRAGYSLLSDPKEALSKITGRRQIVDAPAQAKNAVMIKCDGHAVQRELAGLFETDRMVRVSRGPSLLHQLTTG